MIRYFIRPEQEGFPFGVRLYADLGITTTLRGQGYITDRDDTGVFFRFLSENSAVGAAEDARDHDEIGAAHELCS